MMLNGLVFAIAYLDNILMNSSDKEQHKSHVHQVVKHIQDYGFKLKDGKCEFFLRKIKYLGQIFQNNEENSIHKSVRNAQG